jgi:protein-S-isoprenylcysteine O-methyltransferase Ste14
MSPTSIDLAPLTLLWTGYFAIHSLMASLWMKHWVRSRSPKAERPYRLIYVVLSLALLIPPVWLMFNLAGEPLWQWQGPWSWAANLLAVAALLGFWHSTRVYDMRAFLGLKPVATGQTSLRLSPVHRFVRHPWYLYALIILWTRDMSTAHLVSAVCITLYFWIGARLEDRKLELEYGAPYRLYRTRVPGFIPRPWRYITACEARELVAASYRAREQDLSGRRTS